MFPLNTKDQRLKRPAARHRNAKKDTSERVGWRYRRERALPAQRAISAATNRHVGGKREDAGCMWKLFPESSLRRADKLVPFSPIRNPSRRPFFTVDQWWVLELTTRPRSVPMAGRGPGGRDDVVWRTRGITCGEGQKEEIGDG